MKDLASGRRQPVLPEVVEPDSYGLVYVGGTLTPHTVIEAYIKGCFPWTGSHPIPWCAPNPRLILFPELFKASKKLKRIIRNKDFTVCFDHNFESVMLNCATIPRKGQKGTWITENMIDVYGELHRHHIAHSVEVYKENLLCGGLYGLTLGGAFFGESMFSWSPNTSKIALYALCCFLMEHDFDFIDCQQVTQHLISLGATPVFHHKYRALLQLTLLKESLHKSWQRYRFKRR